MRRTLILLVTLGAFAAPAGAVEDPTIPQEDPRSLGWDSGGSVALARDGETFYIVEDGPNCADDGSTVDEVCVWGPVDFDSLTGDDSLRSVPTVPLLDYPRSPLPGGHDVVAAIRDGNVQVGVITTAEVIVEVMALDGSGSAVYRTEPPCDGQAVFDEQADWLWFSCGPTALNYQTGTLLIFAEGDQLVVPRPGGGVVGLKGGADPTIGVFDAISGDIFMPAEILSGATMMAADTDSTRGMAILFRTPCADPCEQDPAEPADVFAEPDELADFWLTWVGWDGEVEDEFGVVKVGTGPAGVPGSNDAGTVDTDGDLVIVSLPVRTIDELAPDAAVNVWRLVEVDGTLRSPFEAYGNVTLDFQLAWGGVVHLGFIDGSADVSFWHLTDQGRFFDDAGQFESDIEALAEAGVTLGCTIDGSLFCPDDPVTRAQMASFLARWLMLDLDAADVFDDDTGSTHESSINAIASAGITLGCSATNPAEFCPDDLVTRAQMASFIVRALALAPDLSDRFTDDDGSTHETSIDAIATAGITLGCDVTGTVFCPDDPVLRKHMAAFLVRAGL